MKLSRNIGQHGELRVGGGGCCLQIHSVMAGLFFQLVDLFSNGRFIALDLVKIGNFYLVLCVAPKLFVLKVITIGRKC